MVGVIRNNTIIAHLKIRKFKIEFYSIEFILLNQTNKTTTGINYICAGGGDIGC